LTPRFILEALGTFDLDPCAAPDPILWPTAREHYVFPSHDGLLLPWHGRIWLNCPYGRALGTWLRRLATHGVGTALCFARTETEPFFSYIWERADALLFLKSRLHFHYPNGVRATANCGGPSVLVAYGAMDAEILLDSGLEGAPVALNRPTMIHLALAPDPGIPNWREIVRDVVDSHGGRATLRQLYAAIEEHPKSARNKNWKAKVRQTVSRMRLTRTGAATYGLRFTADTQSAA
jgi:hypothetical protein